MVEILIQAVWKLQIYNAEFEKESSSHGLYDHS